MDGLTASLVDWSRAQFALTAMYHWLFVPLTLGLSVIMSIMETIYYRTGNEMWKRITKFWMTLFGVNFAIGVATGIILEFQFGTNWSNYSWFVGDIFGAPLAIEGIMAFFLESVFSAVMFFGWKRVSKGFHLASTWLTTLGATISALWILVANSWMQYPVGMKFNPEAVRNEMDSFFDVLLSPVAVNKFTHTVFSAWVLGAVFVVAVSCWFLLKNRNSVLAAKSIRIASVFGLVAMLLTMMTGDKSAKVVAHVQPMKLAAMEGLYDGSTHQDIVAFGVLNPDKYYDNDEKDFLFAIKIPSGLSWLSYGRTDAFVPGINNILAGGYEQPTLDGGSYEAQSLEERVASGKLALDALALYREARAAGDDAAAAQSAEVIDHNFKNFGYGYVTSPDQVVPPVALTFYAFHIMVILGGYFLLYFIVVLWLFGRKKSTPQKDTLRPVKWIALLSLPLAYIMSQAGWITAEVGRQPWTIQDILPTFAAVSKLSPGTVQTTFWLFTVLFTLLLVADIWIIVRQVKQEKFDETASDDNY
jgi:cytochrome d ubiquinol oxidase subunit I